MGGYTTGPIKMRELAWARQLAEPSTGTTCVLRTVMAAMMTVMTSE